MRLTLRTLLAYLDGILPAAARDDLAKQVDGNATAESLIKRIRRAVARPEIPAPKVDGRGLADDANTVAEYLDNSLPADRLADFEKICLESDLHLAEVAACHELLAQVARDPAVIKPLDAASHDRLLQLFHHRAAVEAAAAERDEARENAVAVRTAVEQARHTPRPDTTRGGRAAERRPWLAWASAAVALLVLLLAGGVLIWKVTSDGRRVAAKRAAAPAAVAEAEPQPPAEDAAPPLAADDAQADAADAIRPVTDTEAAAPAAAMPKPEQPPSPDATAALDKPAAALPINSDTTDPFSSATDPPAATAAAASPMTAEESAPVDSLPPAQQPRVPQGDALAIAAGPAAAMPRPEPPAAPPIPAAANAADSVGVVAPGGVLLHRVLRAGRQTWVYFPAGEPLTEREELIVTPGGDAEIDLDGIGVKLLRGTQATLSIDPDGTPRITVVIGRIIARAMTAEKQLGITAGRLHGVVTAGLTEPVAAAVELERRPGDDPAADPARMVATVMATTGGLSWHQLPMASPADPAAGSLLGGIAEEGLLEARSALVWDSLRPERAVTDRRSSLGWAGGPEPIDPLTRRAADSLAAALQNAQPLFDSLRDMAISHRSENRALAAAALALIGEYDELVILLSADRPGERLEASQWLAVEAATVPLALARGANSGAKLAATLLDRGPPGKGEMLYSMARGFSDAELAAGADAVLVEALDDPDLVVRRYAAKNLFEIVQPAAADRIRYRPDGLEEIRRQGAAWWRTQLEKQAIRRKRL